MAGMEDNQDGRGGIMATDNDKPNYRKERIERLFDELRYEITRGIMENEIEEEFGFQFIVPVSKAIQDGVVECRFQSRPVFRSMTDLSPTKLRLVKNG
jgi:hypothetical protein